MEASDPARDLVTIQYFDRMNQVHHTACGISFFGQHWELGEGTQNELLAMQTVLNDAKRKDTAAIVGICLLVVIFLGVGYWLVTLFTSSGKSVNPPEEAFISAYNSCLKQYVRTYDELGERVDAESMRKYCEISARLSQDRAKSGKSVSTDVATDQKARPLVILGPKDKLMGQWYDNASGQMMSLIKIGDEFVMDSRSEAGFKPHIEKLTVNVSGSQKTYTIRDNDFGEYYLVDKARNLRIYDRTGLIRVVAPVSTGSPVSDSYCTHYLRLCPPPSNVWP